MAGEYDLARSDKLLKALDAAVGSGDLDVAREIGLMLKQERLRTEPTPHYKIGQEGMPEAIKEVAAGEGVGAQRLAGIGTAPMVAGHAIGQMVGADNKADLQNWQTLRSATPNTQYGNIAGNVGMFGLLPPGAASAGAAAFGKTLPRLGTIADMIGTQGAIGYATTPGGVGERATGAALNMMGAGAPTAMGAAQGTRRMVTKPGARLGLAEGLRRELGPDSASLETALRGTYPASSLGVQPSSAMLTRNPTLEVLESGSRVRMPDQWVPLDRMNAAARWRALEDAAGTSQELAKLRDARDVLTKDIRETALHNARLSSNPLTGASPFVQGEELKPLQQILQTLRTGEARPNRDVQTLVNYVSGELGERVTPEQLYTVRKMLTDGIKAGPTSELSQAARAARPQRVEIIGAIDSALDELSGGGWKKYLETYKMASPLINSRQALMNVTDDLKYARPVGEVPLSLGEKPSPYALGKLLERHGKKTFGSKEIDQLIPQHRALAEMLLSDLNAQAGVMSARGTLGSPTAPFIANAGRINALTEGLVGETVGRVPFVGNNLGASIKGSMARKSEEALAEILKNPQLLAEELRKAAIAQDLLIKSGRAGAGIGASLRGKE